MSETLKTNYASRSSVKTQPVAPKEILKLKFDEVMRRAVRVKPEPKAKPKQGKRGKSNA